MKNKMISALILLAVFSISTNVSAYQIYFTPKSSVSFEYTDNIFLSDKNEEDEFLTEVSAGFTLEMLEKTKGLVISYDPSYVFYNEYDENDTLRHNAQLYGWMDFTKNTRLEITDRFLFTEDPLGEEDLIRDEEVVIPGDTTVRRSRNEYYTNTAIMKLNHRFGVNNNAYASFLHSFLRNDDSTVYDNDRYEPSIGLNYWFGPKSEYGIETMGRYTVGKFSRDNDRFRSSYDDFDEWYGSFRLIRNMSRHFSVYARYEHTYRDYDGINDNDYKLYMTSAGFKYKIDYNYDVILGVGYYHQSVDDADNENGMFGSGELRKTWYFRRGDIRLSGQMGMRPNDFGAQQLGLERFVTVGADGNYYFARNVMGNIMGRFHYSDPIDTEESEGIEKQKRYVGGVGLIYFPLKWLSVNLRYQHTRLDSDTKDNVIFIGRTDDDYKENRIMLMVLMQADPPWRF